MAEGTSESTGPTPVLSGRHPYARALAMSLQAVRAQEAEQLEWLGARREGACWTLPVLEDSLAVDFRDGAVRARGGKPVGAGWQILTLHYLAVSGRPAPSQPAVTFSSLPDAHAFAPVYQRRVIDHLCRTIGRESRALRRAAEALGARNAPGGDVGLDFSVYSRIRLRLVWHAGDAELPPSAVLLLPGNIGSFLCLEDTAVLSQSLVARLAGESF